MTGERGMVTVYILESRSFLGRMLVAGQIYEVGTATAALLVEKGYARLVAADAPTGDAPPK